MGLIDTATTAALSLARAVGLVPARQVHKGELRTRDVTHPGPYWDRDPAMLGNALTPQRLTSILADRNQGYLQAWADLADEMVEHDPHLFSQLALRAQSVVETEFTVVPGEGTSKQKAKVAADACRELYTHWASREGEGGCLEDWQHEWVWGKFYGRSGHEILWTRDGGAIAPEGLSLIGTRRLSLACDPADPDPWALRLWDADGIDQTRFSGQWGTKLSDLGADKVLAFEPRVRGAQKTREGLFAVIVWFELFRVWSWRELMALAEMVSRPPVIAYYAAGGARADGDTRKMNGERYASPDEKAAAQRVVLAKTGALRALLPDTVRLEALRYSLPTTDPVPILTSRECEALVSKTIHGVANLSDLKAGARAAVEAQERTTYTFWRADCRSTTRLVTGLFARYVRANPQRFGEGCPVPRLVAQTEAATDTKAVGDRLVTARSLGISIPRAWAHEALEIPQPKDGEAVLEPTAPTPAAATDESPSKAPPRAPPATPPVKASRVALAAGAVRSGVILCLVPSPELAAQLAVEGGEAPADLHVTLAHLGAAEDLDAGARATLLAVATAAVKWMPRAGTFNGVARFATDDGTDAAVLTLDAPGLSAARERLVSTLAALGFAVSAQHGFVPHLTRGYVAPDAPTPGGERFDPTAVRFASVALWCGARRRAVAFEDDR